MDKIADFLRYPAALQTADSQLGSGGKVACIGCADATSWEDVGAFCAAHSLGYLHSPSASTGRPIGLVTLGRFYLATQRSRK